jgi:hypothetical protein
MHNHVSKTRYPHIKRECKEDAGRELVYTGLLPITSYRSRSCTSMLVVAAKTVGAWTLFCYNALELPQHSQAAADGVGGCC